MYDSKPKWLSTGTKTIQSIKHCLKSAAACIVRGLFQVLQGVVNGRATFGGRLENCDQQRLGVANVCLLLAAPTSHRGQVDNRQIQGVNTQTISV